MVIGAQVAKVIRPRLLCRYIAVESTAARDNGGPMIQREDSSPDRTSSDTRSPRFYVLFPLAVSANVFMGFVKSGGRSSVETQRRSRGKSTAQGDKSDISGKIARL